MKKIIAIGMFLATIVYGWSADVKLTWSPNSEIDLAGYRLYQSTNFFNTPITNFISINAPNTNITTTIDIGPTYAYHLTAYNTSGLESDPSNEVRFRMLLAAPNVTNAFTLTGFTNWQSAILTRPPTNGVITGTPPNIFYRRTNATAIKDNFTYSIEKRPVMSDGNNKTYTLLQTRSTIKIDGDLSEWPFAHILVHPTFSIPKGSNSSNFVIHQTHSTGRWIGTNDHSVVFRAVHDSANIYLGIEVRDDYHISTNNSSWNGDSIQLMIANSNRTQIVNTFNASLGGTDGALSNSLTTTFTSTNFTPQIAIVRDSVAKITTYEIKIPSAWANVRLWESNTTFGLGFAINDGDPSETGQGGWSGFGPHSMVFGQSPSETALFRVGNEFPVNNYFSIYYMNPNTPPIITDVEVLRF